MGYRTRPRESRVMVSASHYHFNSFPSMLILAESISHFTGFKHCRVPCSAQVAEGVPRPYHLSSLQTLPPPYRVPSALAECRYRPFDYCSPHRWLPRRPVHPPASCSCVLRHVSARCSSVLEGASPSLCARHQRWLRRGLKMRSSWWILCRGHARRRSCQLGRAPRI